MSRKKGWVSIHRNLFDHWIWNDKEQFDKRSAWIDLLLMVNHEDKKVLIGGQLKLIKRGQRITSLNKLALRWKWSRKKVTNFLQTLEEDDMIILKKEQGKYTLITIVNYSFYQDNDFKKEQARNKWGTSEEQVKNINNNERIMNNNDNKIDNLTEKFNKLLKNKTSVSIVSKNIDKFGYEKIELLLNKTSESEWLSKNLDLKKLGNKVLEKALNDKYKDFEEEGDDYDWYEPIKL